MRAEEALRRLQEEYDNLSVQMEQTLCQTIERANRMAMESELAHIILSQVFNASHDGTWAVDKNRKILRVNKKMLEILGKGIKDVMGKQCREICPPVCSAGCCPLEAILKRVPLVEHELQIPRPDGSPVSYLLTATPLRGLDGDVVGVVETFRDISERKHAEEIMRRANEELERLATRDGLTRLANRRRFDEFLDLEWRRMRREQTPISLIMCDVDHFKLFNDTYGHQAGDDCLRGVAAAIGGTVNRAGDLAARYGGEEFAVILSGTGAEGARLIAENIRQHVLDLQIPHAKSPVSPYVTLSGGLSSLVPRDDHPERLIQAADEALYLAKQRGRNRICRQSE